MEFKDLNNASSEVGVIASIIKHPDFALEVDDLTPNDFYFATNKSIFWAVKELAMRGSNNIDAYLIKTTLESAKAKDEKIGKVELEDISDIVDMSDDIARHEFNDFEVLVNDVKDFSGRRDLYSRSNELARMCLSDYANVSSLQEYLYDIVEDNSLLGSRRNIQEGANKLDSIIDEISALQKADVVKLPLPTLSNHIKLFQGQLAVFCGKTKSGKSAMLLTCFLDAIRQGKHVLYIDTELDDVEFTMRLLAQASGVPYGSIECGRYTNEEEERLTKAILELKRLKWHHEYIPVVTGTEILNLFKKVNAREKVDLFIMDYFKDAGEGTAFEGSQRLGNLVNLVKNEIAGAYQIPALGAAQLNPSGEIAASNRLAMFASAVIKILRKTDEEVQRDGAEYGLMKLVIVCNRRGACHASEDEYISVKYDGPTLKFSEPDSQPQRNEDDDFDF